MLRRIQRIRFGWKTTLIVLLLAVAVWAVFVYVRVRDFVPEELTEPVRPPGGEVRP